MFSFLSVLLSFVLVILKDSSSSIVISLLHIYVCVYVKRERERWQKISSFIYLFFYLLMVPSIIDALFLVQDHY